MASFTPRTIPIPGEGTLTLRPASEDDAETLLAFLRAESATTDQVLTQPDEFPATADEERAKIREHDRTGGMLMLALIAPAPPASGPALAGVLSIRPGQRRRNAHTAEFGITIAHAWRARGLGTLMLRAMLDWAANHPTIEKVCLQVFSTNPRAMALYERLGFREEGRQPGQAQLRPGHYVDNIHMGLWVKPRRVS
ncbi:MAG: GNAT family protein [Phycisphaerales bacterium]